MAWSDILFTAGFLGRICVGLVFMTAAIGKLRHGPVFEGVLANYRILPRQVTPALAAVLPWAELVLGGLLLAQVLNGLPALAAIILLLTFAWAMAINIKRGRSHIDCGCHNSALRQPLRWSLVIRNVLLGVLLVPALFPTSPLDAPLVVVGVVGGVCVYLLYLLFNTLAALPPIVRSAA